MTRQLVDDSGENKALRSFLMQYSCDRSITVPAMALHMRRSGWANPKWVTSCPDHLTKAIAQRWIRFLIALESNDSSTLTK